METKHFDCDCYAPEHTARFVFFDASNGWEPSLEVEFYLHHHQEWYKRLWTAIKYLFGCKANVFCGFMMKKEDVPEFKKLVENFERELDIYKNEHKKKIPSD